MILLGLGFALDWFLGLALRAPEPPNKRRLHRTRWLVLPAAALLVIVAVMSELPFKVRYRMSEQALRVAAARVLAGETISTPCWIGWHPVKGITRPDRPGVVGFITGQSISDPVGFACTPTGCQAEEW